MDEAALKEMKKGWQERTQRKDEEENKRRIDARCCAEKVAVLLKEKYGVKKVYLYGSLVWGKHYTVHSDIDLFVEGFPAGADYWAALAEADHVAVPFPLNIVLAENAQQSLHDKVIKEGAPL